MQVLIELNTNPTNRANEFAITPPEEVARRNQWILRKGNVVNWVVIGVAESPAAAREFIEDYRAKIEQGVPN